MARAQKQEHKIATLLILIVLLGIGYFILSRYFAKNALQEETTSEGQSPISDWKIYRNEQYGFEVKYPSDLDSSVDASDSSFGYAPPHFNFSFPNKYGEYSTFGAATLRAGLVTKNSMERCRLPNLAGFYNPEIITINGKMFEKTLSAEGAAGSRYFSTRYVLMKENSCFVIEYVIQSLNRDGEPEFRSFDSNEIKLVFEKIISTIVFID